MSECLITQVACQMTSPLADVVGSLLGEYSLLEHVVESMDSTQLQSLLFVENFSFAHTLSRLGRSDTRTL